MTDTPINLHSQTPEVAQPKAEAESTRAPECDPGTMVGERYRIISLLGRGGMGVVYKVEQVYLHKIYALKTIDGTKLSAMAARRFQQEAKAASAIDHPNVVKVHDFGMLDEETPFMVMDLVEGTTLFQRLKNGTLSIDEAVPIFTQVCLGLHAAHCQNVVHRDIKPSNIILVDGVQRGVEGSVKVLDFGIAKITQNEAGEIQTLTQTGEIFGSPLYMSPEQCRGDRVDQRSDIYSLGCVLFEALTGTSPFIGENALATLIQHQSELAPTLKEASLGSDYPRLLERIVAKMLAKDATQRYENMGEVAIDLAKVPNQMLDTTGSMKAEAKRQSAKASGISLSLPVLLALIFGTAALFCAAGFFIHSLISKDAKIEAHNATTPQSPTEAVIDRQIKIIERERALDKEREKQREEEKERERERERAAHSSEVGAVIGAMSGGHLSSILSKKLPRDGELKIGGVEVDANAMKAIAVKKGVKKLTFIYATIDNDGLKELRPMDLGYIHLGGCTLKDSGAEELARWPNLRIVHCDNTPLSDEGIIKLASLPKLFEIELSHTALTKKGIEALAKNKSLSVLRINGIYKLTDSDLEPLAHSKLMVLDAQDNEIGDASVDTFLRAPALGCLNLNGTKINYQGALRLLKCHRITRLCLAECRNISDEDMHRLVLAAPKTTTLVLTRKPIVPF